MEPLRESHPRISEFQLEALLRQTYANFAGYASLAPRLGEEIAAAVTEDRDAGHLADFIAQNVSMRVADKQSILDEVRPVQRLSKLNRLLHCFDILCVFCVNFDIEFLFNSHNDLE